MGPVPNKPKTNQAEVDALRANAVLRTPEDDVPAGKAWTPTEADHKPLRKPQEMEIPDFIPLRLDAPVNEAQAQIAAAARKEQGQDDFDPEVDRADDVFVGAAGMRSEPSRMETKAGVPVQRPIVTSKKQAQEALSWSRSQSKPTEHPVLRRLRERFGLKANGNGIKTKNIGGFDFGFRKYSNQAYAKFVINEVQPDMETDAEFYTKLPYALAAISIASIDGVPAHEVFASETGTDELPTGTIPDPLFPPVVVTVATARAVYPWLCSLTIPEFGDKLARTLSELFPDQDFDTKGLHRYECPKHKCTETFDRLPKQSTGADGEVRPYYCPVHGVPMRDLGLVEDLVNVPLA